VASLLYQVLSGDPEVREVLYKEFNLSSKQSLADWSLHDLEKCLCQALHSIDDGVCVFIDGLDEIDPHAAGGKFGLVKMLERLSSIPHTKFCVASREENVFQDAYGNFPKLRLQNLNGADIQKYVETSVQQIKPDSSIDLSQKKIESLVYSIVERADGVFLWACVVVNNILRAFSENSDDFQHLIQRIGQLPNDLSKLYTEMWNRMNPDDKSIYQAESALYFRLVLESKDSGVSQLGALICARPEFAHRLFTGGPHAFTEEYLRRECRTLERRVHARCAGLLQISPPRRNEPWTTSLLGYFLGHMISFVHISAVDWFSDTSHVHSILQHEKRSTEELQFRVGLGYIAALLTENIDHEIVARLAICSHLQLLNDDLQSQLDSEYLEFLAGTQQRSPLGGLLKTDLHLVEFAAWIGLPGHIRNYIQSVHNQDYQKELEIKSKILSWLCCRLWDLATDLNGVADDKWIEILTLVSTLLSSNSDLEPFHADTGLRYMYDTLVIVQPAIVSFLLAFSLTLESGREMSPQLQSALLDVMCNFLEYKEICGFKVKVNIGSASGFMHSHGYCWSSTFRTQSDVDDSIALRVQMEAAQIFRYSRLSLVNLTAFSTLTTEKQSLIKAFLDVPKRPLEGERLKFRTIWNDVDEEFGEIEVYSTALDSEMLNSSIQLAEDGHKGLFSDLSADRQLEQMDVALYDDFWKKMESNSVLIHQSADLAWANDPVDDSILFGRELKDLYSGTPDKVSLSDIDWSEKPQYAALDEALKKFSIKSKQTPTEDL
jgi:hypothetical protein